MKQTRTNDAAICPRCGHKLNGASSVFTDARPAPGDLSICISCLAPLVFNDDLTLRPIRESDFAEMSQESAIELARAQHLMLAARMQKRL